MMTNGGWEIRIMLSSRRLSREIFMRSVKLALSSEWIKHCHSIFPKCNLQTESREGEAAPERHGAAEPEVPAAVQGGDLTAVRLRARGQRRPERRREVLLAPGLRQQRQVRGAITSWPWVREGMTT